MKKLRIPPIFLLFIASCMNLGCQGEFLDIKRNKSTVVPSTLSDFESLLDNSSVMNLSSSLELAQISTDEYIIRDEQWNLLTSPMEKNAYVWNKEIFEGGNSRDWNYAFRRVLYANIVLEGLENLDVSEPELEKVRQLRGRSLFFRSLAFYELAQLFCDTYDDLTAERLPGIPLRLESDITLNTPRSTIKETYERILADLKIASDLLPVDEQVKQRPTKQAAYALLARVYLQMGKYGDALHFANSVLQMSEGLVDYNALDIHARYPFPRQGIGNKEVIFLSRVATSTIVNSLRFNANPEFLDKYAANDLRRSAFFFNNPDGRVLFKGSYNGELHCFTGLAIDEVVLIAAECHARIGELDDASRLLFSLQLYRYEPGSISRLEVNNQELILDVILEERIKQLYRRGIYWNDLKRLNLDERRRKTLVRTVNGVSFELLPLDKRYVFPIPDDVIQLGGIEQNGR